jgi:hypothetical protein
MTHTVRYVKLLIMPLIIGLFLVSSAQACSFYYCNGEGDLLCADNTDDAFDSGMYALYSACHGGHVVPDNAFERSAEIIPAAYCRQQSMRTIPGVYP